jgi:2-C-methyl-D-erythritol 4-phosphate cytidylyltransferase
MIAAVVVAAGQGVRFGGQKQFLALGTETVAGASVRVARSVAHTVVLVVPSDYTGDGEGADFVVVGGNTRASSVRAGLKACGDAEIVIVHDAARPLASTDLFRSVVIAVRDGADAAIPGLSVSDTVKRVRRDDDVLIVTETIPRDEVVLVQTPQAFRTSALRDAHKNGGDATDDAALVEANGGRVVVVPGEKRNVKITEPSDIDVVRESGAK